MIIEVSNEDQIKIVVSLAREIWSEYFIPIIGKEQVNYMLNKFQSKRAIADQIDSQGFLYFLIKEEENFIGYIGVQPRENELLFSKIYIKSSDRGKGYGKRALQFLKALARGKGLSKITLVVHKNNTNTIKVYEKLGFENLGTVVRDIGNGFVMDDYEMETIF